MEGPLCRREGRNGLFDAARRGLAAALLRPQDLDALPGSDPRKAAIARAIRGRTTVSMSWIAERLSMRSAANASQQIRRRSATANNLPAPLKAWINLSSDVA